MNIPETNNQNDVMSRPMYIDLESFENILKYLNYFNIISFILYFFLFLSYITSSSYKCIDNNYVLYYNTKNNLYKCLLDNQSFIEIEPEIYNRAMFNLFILLLILITFTSCYRYSNRRTIQEAVLV